MSAAHDNYNKCSPLCNHNDNRTQKQLFAEILANRLLASKVILNEADSTITALQLTGDLRRNFNAKMLKDFAAASQGASATEVMALRKAFEKRLKKSLLDSFNRGVANRGLVGKALSMAEARELSPGFGSFLDSQLAYSDNFVQQFGRGELARPGRMGIGQRVNLYAQSFKGAFNMGAVAGGRPDEVIYWNLGSCDHCKDCPALNISGPYTRNTLPTTPGAGGTACGNNCCCYLSFKPGPSRPKPPEDSPSQWQNPPQGEARPNSKQLAHLRDLEMRKNAIRRQISNAGTAKERARLYKIRSGLQGEIRKYKEANGIIWKPEFGVGRVISGDTLSPKSMNKILFRGLDGTTISKADLTRIGNEIERSSVELINAARDAGILKSSSASIVSRFGVDL